jgi:GWxTD domain-containing protein
MSLRPSFACAVLAAAILGAPGAQAQKLDKEAKKWLEEVAPIILPDEEKAYRSLKDKGDALEFQKIFWARRDPDLETPENEYQVEYLKVKAEADRRYKVLGRAGSSTDCGRVFILLGEPDDVKKEPGSEGGGLRLPENWTYKDRPGITFQGGQIVVGFDGECQLPQGARFADSLVRIAEGKILRPNFDYQVREGKLGKKLVDLLPKPSPALTLLKQPRQDISLATHVTMTLRSSDGATYVGGLLRGDAAGLDVQDTGGRKTAKVVVATQVLSEAAQSLASTEQETLAEVIDGSFIASYGLSLRPGKYTLKAAALDPKSGKGAVATVPLEMPDYSGLGGMTLSPVLVLQDIQEIPGAPDPKDAYAAFALGPVRMIPRFANTFTKADAVTLICAVYSPKVDASTGKPSMVVSYSILKDGTARAQAADQPLDVEAATPSVGPVPLATYEPGKYVARIKVRDNVAQKDYTRDTEFEIK